MNDKGDVLYQWEITPQEEKSVNKKLIPLVLLFLFYMISRTFFDAVNNKDRNTLFGGIINYWNSGGWGTAFAVVLTFCLLTLFGIMLWTLFILWKRSGSKNPEKFVVSPSGLKIISHSGLEESYQWPEFKGFIKTAWYGGLAFELINKRSIFPYLYPSRVVVRGEKDNSEQIHVVIKKYLPDMTNHYFTGWKITAVVIIVLAVLGGVFYGISVTKSRLSTKLPTPIPTTSTPYSDTVDIASSKYSDQLQAYTSSGMTIVAPRGWKALGGSSCIFGDPYIALVSPDSNKVGVEVRKVVSHSQGSDCYYNAVIHASPFFPEAMSRMKSMVYTRNLKPIDKPGLVISRVSPQTIIYSQPVNPDGVENNGIVYLNDAGDNFSKFVQMEVRLPPDQREFALELIRIFKGREILRNYPIPT